ncbi:MAG TPA: regulatory protein RecX [Gammaproteobacteria bacterium]|nr:regulatory protein RecX [Gammaproteobacteria bacterium]
MSNPGQESDSVVSAVYDAAIRLLVRREHSVAELRRKLQSRGHDGEIVEQVLERLQEERLLSNERFVEAYVRSRYEKGFGPLRIQAELRERGVPGALVAQGIEPEGTHWVELMSRVRQKRFGSALPADYPEQARQMRFLQYRGFAVEQIRQLLQREG